MSTVETAHPLSRYMNHNAHQMKNNNNSQNETMNGSQQVQPTEPTANQQSNCCAPTGCNNTPPRHTLSPSSASQETMSPPPDHRNMTNGYHYNSGSYQSNFVNAVNSYTTNLQPKKSFCIDALLSKSKVNGNQSPPTTKPSSEDEAIQQYTDDRRDYASSPDDDISR